MISLLTNYLCHATMYDKEMYGEFDNEVKPGEEICYWPKEPPMMLPGFIKEHTGYNTYQDHCGTDSAVHTWYMDKC